jgi:hypothetical protein
MKEKKISFLLASGRSMMKLEGSGPISQRHGSADPDPDPHQNVSGSATQLGGKGGQGRIVITNSRQQFSAFLIIRCIS